MDKIPNLVSLSRLILFGPLAAYFCFLDRPTIGFSLFALAVITDILDGWLARRLGVVSSLGGWLDLLGDGATWIPFTLVAIYNDWLLIESVSGGVLLAVGVTKVYPKAPLKVVFAVAAVIPLSVTVAKAFFG